LKKGKIWKGTPMKYLIESGFGFQHWHNLSKENPNFQNPFQFAQNDSKVKASIN
jgi:hypothetical protein